MSFRPYIIEVKGNIIAKEGKNYTQSWVAGSCSDGSTQLSQFIYDEKKHSISGDIVFDKKMRAVPYAHYVATGAVSVQEGVGLDVDLFCSPGFYPAFAYFNEYIMELRSCLDILVDERIRDIYYNGLYISAFSVLELFLCDFLLCGVFSREEFYIEALKKLGISESADQYDVEYKLKGTIFDKVFHRFDDVRNLYRAVLGIDIPSYKKIHDLIYRRHNIVHRFALSSKDRMLVCSANYGCVLELICTICQFVEKMKDMCGLNVDEKKCLEIEFS